ncbi:MAG: hypothetical protein Q8O56_02360 [Solirubrobacteraceae bacterium]|nr:hypothetical protein [Solirubrobacteraceae bacterium]
MRPRFERAFGERWAGAVKQANAEFLELLERMVELGEDERQVAVAEQS